MYQSTEFTQPRDQPLIQLLNFLENKGSVQLIADGNMIELDASLLLGAVHESLSEHSSVEQIE